MHKRMSRILAALSLLTLFPVFASASPARVEALNVPGDYVKDYAGMFTYLSGVSGSGNLVWAQPDGNGNQGMGAILGNLWEGRLGTWGVNLRRVAPSLGQPMFGDPITTTINSGIFSDPNFTGEAFDLMWGKKMGSGSLGLRLNRSFVSNDSAGTTEGNGNFERNIWGVGGGFGFALNQNSDVELSALFQNRSFQGVDAVTPGGPAADNGGATYQLAGRMMIKGGGNLTVVPVVKYYKFDLSETGATPATNADRTLSGWTAGVSGNWAVGSDDMLILGAQFVGNHAEQTIGAGAKQDLKETFYPNVFLGMENHINSWLTLRAGAQNAMMLSVRNESGNPAVTTTAKLHAFSFNMGAGVKLGTLQLDATLAQDFWNNPLRVLGVSDAAPTVASNTPFPRVSATYSF